MIRAGAPERLHEGPDIENIEKYKHFGQDPWETTYNLNRLKFRNPSPLSNGDHMTVVIPSAGHGALLYTKVFICIRAYG